MRGAGTIFLKDLRLRVRDRSVFLFAVVVPLGLTLVLSFILPSEEDLAFTAAVIDLDGSEVAAGFVDGVVPGLVEAGLVEVHDADDEAAAVAALEEGEAAAAWIVPDGFGEAVTSGQPATLRVLADPGQALAAEVARSVADGYAAQLERTSLAVATATVAGDDLAPDQLEAVAAAAAEATPAVTLGELVAEDRRLDPTSYLAAGMAVFFVFFTVQYGVSGLLEERQQGTLPRLLAAPIRISAVHVGKAIGALVVGLVSMTVLAVGSSLLLGAEWGRPAGVAILLFAAVLSALGVMALVGSFARNAEQASNLQSVVAIVLGLLGGVFFPVGGGVLGQLSLVSPHGWFLRGLGDLVGTGRWTAVLPAAGALVVFAVVAAVPGALRLRGATA